MHHQRIRLGQLHELLVDLITAQHFQTLGGFSLPAHRNPDVGVKQVRAVRGGLQIFGANNFSAGAF